MLAYEVFQYNNGAPATPINLKGIMVGNGCIGNAAGHCGEDALNDLHDVQTFRGHGLISDPLYQEIISTCNWTSPSLACDLLLGEAELLTLGVDVYDLYNQCPDPAAPAPPPRALRAPVGSRSMLGRRLARERAARTAAAVTVDAAPLRARDDPECWGSGPALEAWANTAEVKAALHVAPGITFALCSNNFTFNYNSDMADERKVIYPTLTQQAGYRVVIYNGEADLFVIAPPLPPLAVQRRAARDLSRPSLPPAPPPPRPAGASRTPIMSTGPGRWALQR